MIKIQLIGNGINKSQYTSVIVSPLNAPKSLDEFDINIIDISSRDLWKNKNNTKSEIDIIADFVSIQTMIEHKSKSKVVIVYPQNSTYFYDRNWSQNSYYYSSPLKDMISSVCSSILSRIIPSGSVLHSLIYENTRTTIGNCTYEADFYFDCDSEAITPSNMSNKTTTIKLTKKDVYATTLKITRSEEVLMPFLEHLFLNSNKENVPAWVSDIIFYDDTVQKNIISEKEIEIENANKLILAARENLEKNASYKSILYTNGQELVSVVFEILEHLLNYNLSEFVDEKKEDFLIKLPKCTFIGEIKGVTSNVRFEHISQLELHFRGYLDDLTDAGIDEDVKQLLIINPFKNKPLHEREAVHAAQIELAVRNGCLIIETNTLLQIFEKFLQNEITTEQCIDVLSTKTGLLSLTDFNCSRVIPQTLLFEEA